MNLPRILSLACFAVLLLPLSAQAATIFGTNMLANASATTEKKIVFTPWPPGPWAQGLNIISRRSVSATFSSTGAFSISLVQGLYDVAIDNQQSGSIVVPDSTDTININSVWASVLFFRTASEFGMVRQDTNDTTQGFLPQKLEAGTNIVLTASTNGAFRTLKINSTASGGGGSGDVTASNTLTNLMPLLGSGEKTVQATNAAGFRAAVGLVIGTDVQAFSATLSDWAALPTNSITAFLTEAEASALYQGTNANLTAWAALATSAKQDADADLDDLSDGSLTGSKVGTGISGDNITSGTVADARIDAAITRDAEAAAAYQPLDADLTDLADGTLTASKLGTGLDAANIADGTVSNAEFQRLDATSSIQTQLDGKQASLGYVPVNKAGDSMSGALTGPSAVFTNGITAGASTFTGTIEARNSTTSMSNLVYGTFTDTSNYRRGRISDSTAGVFDISSEGLGTGATGNTLRLLTGGTARLTISSTGVSTFSGNVEIAGGSGYRISSGGYWTSPSNGAFTFWNDSFGGFDRLQFGGTSASFPALKRSTTNLIVRLADDSADTGLTANTLNLSKTITAAGTTGNQTINKAMGSVNFAAAGQTITVTSDHCDANSIIMATVATDDTTAKSCIAVPGAGSFVLKLNAAATAETKVSFLIVN